MKNIYYLIAFLLFGFAAPAFAQTGILKGKITDAANGEEIIGATIMLDGTQLGGVTDVNGEFTISRIPAGTYTAIISYVSYKTKKMEGLTIGAGQVVSLETTLEEDVESLNEVVVVGERETNSDVAVINAIKLSQMVVSGVSAEQISRTLDRDASQIVRRVPGITISENNFVQIRGLSSRYNPVMLHNVFAPSVEADVKSFAFNIIPSGQIDRILVFKSPSADNPGEFSGGVVKVFTKSIPEENATTLDYTTQMRSGTTFGEFLSQERGKTHFTGINAGYYDLPGSFPTDLRRANSEQLISAGRSLKNLWTPESRTAPLDQRLSLTNSFRTSWKGIKIGSITAVNYSNSFSKFDVTRFDFNTYNQNTQSSSPIFQYHDSQYNQSIRVGVLQNFAFKFNNNNMIEVKNLFNQNATDQYVNRTGSNFENGTLQDNGSFDKVYRGIYSGQLLGKHTLTEQLKVDWVVGYNSANRTQPDYKRFRSDVDPTNGTKTLFVPIGTAAAEFLGRFFSDMKEKAGTVAGNAEYRLKNAEKSPILKAGFFGEYKDRQFGARNIGYVRSRSLYFDPSLLNLSIGELFNPENINGTTGIRIDEQSNPNDNYTASNKLIAGYAMMDLPLGKLNLIGGVRVEHNVQQLESKFTNGSAAIVNNPITSVLPSLNATYNFSEKFLVRAGYGITVNRPEFRELAPFGFYDFNFNFTYSSNPSLKTPTIHNADLRLEYYPTPNDIISVAPFYKYFVNPIEVVNVPGAGSLGAKEFTFTNAQNARSYGVEIEARKSLLGMTESRFLDNINLVFNATLLQSEIKLGRAAVLAGQSENRPLQGQANYIVNAGIFYSNEESGTQVNLLYNVVGKSIIFVGFEDYPDIYVMPRNVLDLSISQRITPKMQLKVGVSDILNNDILYLQDGNMDGEFNRKSDQAIQRFKPGQVFSVGISYNLR